MSRVWESLVRLHRDQEGGATTEYGIIAAGIGIPAMIGLGLLIHAFSTTLAATINNLFAYVTQ